MPKLISEILIKKIKKDLCTHYKIGENYRSIREIASHFEVSYLTAQKAIAFLKTQGIIDVIHGSGIKVKSVEIKTSLHGKRVVILSKEKTPFFNEAFAKGVRKVTDPEEITVEIVIKPTELSSKSLIFGEYILSLGADGILAVSCDDTSLPFYHAMMHGVDFVANVALEELPILPSVQTNNKKHSEEAAKILNNNGYREILVGTGMPVDHDQFRGFFRDRFSAFKAGLPDSVTLKLVHLISPEAMNQLGQFFSTFDANKAVFSLEMSVNHILASQFVQFNIPVKRDNFIVFDSFEDPFIFEGIPPVRTVAPSIMTLGECCAEKLVQKWKTGTFSEPVSVVV